MTFKIANIKREHKTGNFGNYVSLTIQTQDGQTIYANEKSNITGSWNIGSEVNIEDSSVERKTSQKSGKQYLQIKWPKQTFGAPQPYQPSSNQLNDAIKLTLERIEKKLDRLMDMGSYPDPKDIPNMDMSGLPTDIPPMPEESPF